MKLSRGRSPPVSGACHEYLVSVGLTRRVVVQRFQPWLPLGGEASILRFGCYSCSSVLLTGLGVSPVAGRRSTATTGMRCSSTQLQPTVLGRHQCRPSPQIVLLTGDQMPNEHGKLAC